MTLATATIERFTTTVSELTPITETPVRREPTDEERRDNAFSHMLYVTSTLSADREGVIGTVQTVRTSESSEGWFRNRNNDAAFGAAQRCFGAPLNPPMVNGHYYRALNIHGWMVRYNDDDHTGDRHSARNALSLIAGNNAPWPFPEDSIGMWSGDVPYIEVEAPASTPPADLEEDAEEPVVALVDAHQFVEDTGIDGPTRGLAATEPDSTRVLLSPELVVGEMYIYWTPRASWDNSAMSEARIVTAIDDGTPTFGYLGYWTMERISGEMVPYFYTNGRTVLDDTQPKAWAKLALSVPAVDDSEEATNLARWNRLLNEEGSAFTEFNEATNELATDNDWCSEYEDIVTKVGMEGRSKSVYDYDVDVAVDFSFSADDVSSRLDREIANDYDVPGFSGSSATFSGTATVTVRVSEQEDADDARDQIDSEMVEEALGNMMSGADNIDISDWNIRNTRQV